MADFTFTGFRGMNDFTAQSLLDPDECAIAENVEFWQSPCGSRRQGCTPITLLPALAAEAAITFLARHLPTTDEVDAQLWAWAVTPGVSSTLAYKDTSWHAVGFFDQPILTSPSPYQMVGQTFHGKLYLLFKSNVDRAHLIDSTGTMRRAGLDRPASAPGVSDTAVADSYSGTRYFRTRFATQVAGVTILRSEPSDATTFSPVGTKNGAILTKPTTLGEGETHWEAEASLDNANFYRITTVPIATGTYTDTTSAAVGYNTAGNILSDTIGNYALIPSARYMLIDQDRPIFGGSFADPSKASHIWWGVAAADPTGVGNDERIPVATSNELDLDGYEGGSLTGFGGPINGANFAFKQSHIYQLVRTNQLTRAYEPIPITKERGALPGSIVRGVDESGSAALYFLDRAVGAYRLGSGGLLWAGQDLWNTWQRVNRNATLVVTRALFFPDRHQVIWWLAADGSNTPTLRIVLQTNNSHVTAIGVRKGWTRHTGFSAKGLAACLFADNVEANTARSLTLVPYVAVGNTIQQLNAGTTDAGTPFVAKIVSSPRYVDTGNSGLFQKFGIRAGAVVADADSSAIVNIGLTRDFGVETQGVDVSLAPIGSETPVLPKLDNLALSECTAVQLQISDGAGNASAWKIQQVALLPTAQESR